MLNTSYISNNKEIRNGKTINDTSPGKRTGSALNLKKGNTSPSREFSGHQVPAIRCFRCGEKFPVTDFYYTKKSGLCIPCWEVKGV
jgi:hypothetical protein